MRMVTADGLSETGTYTYDALGRTVATADASGIETRYLYATEQSSKSGGLRSVESFLVRGEALVNLILMVF